MKKPETCSECVRLTQELKVAMNKHAEFGRAIGLCTNRKVLPKMMAAADKAWERRKRAKIVLAFHQEGHKKAEALAREKKLLEDSLAGVDEILSDPGAPA